MNNRIISPSLLSANFTRLSEDIKIVEDFSKNIKSEVITLSTVQKKSISKIKEKLISYAS